MKPWTMYLGYMHMYLGCTYSGLYEIVCGLGMWWSFNVRVLLYVNEMRVGLGLGNTDNYMV